MSLSFKNVSKSYGAVIALKNATLSIEDGEIRALLGGNGSGKSTLAKIAGGICALNNGEMVLNGKTINLDSPKRAKEYGIIITSQELSLFTNLTVEQNLTICTIPCKAGIFVNKKEVKRQACEILDRMKLSHLMGKTVDLLAPNEQYMIEFAKALIQKPKVLIVDEITSALYKEDVEIIDMLLKELKKQGCMVLFISHRMPELYGMCDSVTVMRNGETLGTYKIKEKNEEELLTMMVGNAVVKEHKTADAGGEPAITEKDYIIAENLPIPSYNAKESLTIGKGEIIGVAGLQGHGQSDLVQALFGSIASVNITIDHKLVHIKNERKAVSEGFAYISGDREKDGVFSERSISENISLVSSLVKHVHIDNIRKAIDRFGVKYDSPSSPLTSLSGGNQQKVVVGRWLCNDPKLLLANDPTKGVDVQARVDLHNLFYDLSQKGCPVIMVSSDDDELVDLTRMSSNSRVIVMYEGHIAKTLRGNEITRENIASAALLDNKEAVI